MVNSRFYQKHTSYGLLNLAELLGVALPHNIPDMVINDFMTLDKATAGHITILHNKKYYKKFETLTASVCIVPNDFSAKNKAGTILLKTENPYFALSKLIALFYKPKREYEPQIFASANISKSAIIGKNAYIGPNVVIMDCVQIGDDAIIEAGTFIDQGVIIGDGAKIRSNVSISYSIIGDDILILPGARIGQDGFGFATENGIHHKIFHTGLVVIGNDVEIGANTTIDRGSLDDTIIEDLCRIGNLVEIAHNVQIAKGSIIVSQTGIAGSSKIGKYCVLAGQVGVSGHVNIGDFVQVASRGGVIKDIEAKMIVGGTPAVPINDWHRQSIIMKQLIKNKK